LGVSRTPIREALALLREDRLVAIVPQLGTFMTLISADAVADAAFVREALECSAVRRTAERIEAAGLEDLSANLVAQERAERSGPRRALRGPPACGGAAAGRACAPFVEIHARGGPGRDPALGRPLRRAADDGRLGTGAGAPARTALARRALRGRRLAHGAYGLEVRELQR